MSRCIEAILVHIPDAQCSCNEENNTIVDWVSPVGQQPDQATLDQWISELPPLTKGV